MMDKGKTSMSITKHTLFEFGIAQSKISELTGKKIGQDEALHILVHALNYIITKSTFYEVDTIDQIVQATRHSNARTQEVPQV